MQRSSGSAGQPAHHSENSSAARPAGGPHNGKGKDGKGKDCKGNFFVSAKDVFSKVFLDRFPESANHKQQGRAHLSSKLCFSMIASKEHRISSAPQPAFDSSAAQPASVVEEFEPNI